MSDIVERFNPCNTEACKKRCDNFGIRCEEICIDEIESLRQQLNDAFNEKQILSQRIIELQGLVAILDEHKTAAVNELATLKQSQGEPVAYLVYSSTRNEQEFLYEDEIGDEDGSEITPLYTSAPTIPEGWRLVPIEPTLAMIEEGYAQAWIRNPSNFGDKDAIFVYKAMLAAAPKPEDE